MKKKINIIFLASVLLLASCSKDDLFGFLIGPQPKFIDNNQFAPGFNILGVIRPDSLENQPLSLVHVEKVLPAIGSEDDSLEVKDARVMVYRVENNQLIDSVQFNLSIEVDNYSNYRPSAFKPKAGEHYKIKCTNANLPTLTAETIVPDVPVIADNSITITSNSITFSILHNDSASMFDAILYTGERVIPNRILQVENGDTPMMFKDFGTITSEAKIVIYAYDKNLTEYLTAPNVFIKPNTYRPPFTNVTNGYGCFGSMNLLVRKL